MSLDTIWRNPEGFFGETSVEFLRAVVERISEGILGRVPRGNIGTITKKSMENLLRNSRRIFEKNI